MALLTNKQFISIGAVVAIGILYAKSKADSFFNIFDVFTTPDLGPNVELSDFAKSRTEEYIALGYMKRGVDGFARITPEGERFINSGITEGGV